MGPAVVGNEHLETVAQEVVELLERLAEVRADVDEPLHAPLEPG